MSQTKISKAKGNELFFVQLTDPLEIRRNILETLKEILVVLQKFEKFKQIRHERIESIHKIKALFRQANKMMNDLKIKLPQTNLKALLIKEKREEKPTPVVAPAKVDAPKPEPKVAIKKKPLTEFEKLEAELSSIEGKLKSLN